MPTQADYSLSLRTWELLQNMQLSTELADTDIEFPDEVKRLMRSFLPRYHDGVRLTNAMEVHVIRVASPESGDFVHDR